jgi:hypothetical protein
MRAGWKGLTVTNTLSYKRFLGAHDRKITHKYKTRQVKSDRHKYSIFMVSSDAP